MRLIVDTHVYFWWVTNDRKLAASARAILEDSATEVLLSSVVPWELATKSRRGRWPGGRAAADDIDRIVKDFSLTPLEITIEHARLAGFFPVDHRDPFDRMLAAQAMTEAVPLMTVDPVFGDFNVEVMRG